MRDGCACASSRAGPAAALRVAPSARRRPARPDGLAVPRTAARRATRRAPPRWRRACSPTGWRAPGLDLRDEAGGHAQPVGELAQAQVVRASLGAQAVAHLAVSRLGRPRRSSVAGSGSGPMLDGWAADVIGADGTRHRPRGLTPPPRPRAPPRGRRAPARRGRRRRAPGCPAASTATPCPRRRKAVAVTISWMRQAPRKAPTNDPRPPKMLAPPSTTAVMLVRV